MATPAELKTRIERLRVARDSGVLTIRHGDTSTSYRDLNEIEQTLRSLENELARAEGRSRRRKPGYVLQRGKGL